MNPLTKDGKPARRVLTSGVFDILHPGHHHFLSEAAALGDELVVVVTSDGHATRTKRVPRHSETDRLKLIRGLDFVDEAFIGPDPYDLATTIRRARPDVIALGYDQTFDETELQNELKGLGHEIAVVRVGRLDSAASTRELLDEQP